MSDCKKIARMIQGSDFSENFTLKKNGVVQDLTGLTEATIKLQDADGDTVTTYKKTTGDITVVGDPLQGTLNWVALAAKTAIARVAPEPKDIDITVVGPWGTLTYRGVAVLQIVCPAI